MHINGLLCTTAINWKLKRACKTCMSKAACKFALLDLMIFQNKICLTSALIVFFASAFQPDPILITKCFTFSVTEIRFHILPTKKEENFYLPQFLPRFYIYAHFVQCAAIIF
jgi:hypothetical protein